MRTHPVETNMRERTYLHPFLPLWHLPSANGLARFPPMKAVLPVHARKASLTD